MSRRTHKVAEAIRQVVASAILFELRDPRVKNVTVLGVEVPVDLQTAKVKVSVMGDEKATRLSLKGLEAARGWIQKKIADELDLRWTPVLTFIIDHSLKQSQSTIDILNKLAEERNERLGVDNFSEGEPEADEDAEPAEEESLAESEELSDPALAAGDDASPSVVEQPEETHAP